MDPTISRPGVVMSTSDQPRLARHVRLTFCQIRQRHTLQLPETVVVLNGTGADILELCDGRHTVAEIVAELGRAVPVRPRRRGAAVPDPASLARRWVELADG